MLSRRSKLLLMAIALALLLVAGVGWMVWAYHNPQSGSSAYTFAALMHMREELPIPRDYTGVWRRWDLGGPLREKYEVRDGIMHGQYTSWNEDGEIQKEGLYLNGRMDSMWLFYYDNESLHMRSYWREGYMCGRFTEWDMDGKLLQDGWTWPGITGFGGSQAEFEEFLRTKADGFFSSKGKE